ncbi:MAG: HTTM domain-containing protein [Paracoccaceae bacterium]|nr:HTTM domain-containing protein [Paracoccaceae bacterium]
MGAYLFLDLCLRSRDLTAHYTDFGILPRDIAISYLSPSSFSLHLMNGSAAFQACLFLLAAVFALMLVLGWRTQLATVVCWFLLLSLQNRNTLILSGEDNLALLLLFWAMFLPTGARYSVDAALSENRQDRNYNYYSIGTAALLLQGMSMYFFSALLKTDDIWMPDGTAVYYALHLDYFATPFAIWFRQFEGVLKGLTYYVWMLELVGPILIFSPVLNRPLRAALMLCFMTMHIGFWMCLEIGLFPLISIIMNLTFMPAWMWDAIEERLHYKDQSRLTIWYDRDCGFCRRICHLITTFLFLRDVSIEPAQNDRVIGPLLEKANSWVITDGQSHHLRWRAMCRLVAASPVFWFTVPLLTFKPSVWVGDRAYRWVARNRRWLATVSPRVRGQRLVKHSASRTTNLIAATALVFVTIQNISTLPAAGIRLPEEFQAIRQFFGLYQHWTMFAPYPEMNSPWPVIQGELTDGAVVDVYNMRIEPVDTNRPAVVSDVYVNARWRKYLSNLEDQSYNDEPQRLALNYSRYLCRKWTAKHPSTAPLSTFVVTFNVDWSRPPGLSKETATRMVWAHNCLG